MLFSVHTLFGLNFLVYFSPRRITTTMDYFLTYIFFFFFFLTSKNFALLIFWSIFLSTYDYFLLTTGFNSFLWFIYLFNYSLVFCLCLFLTSFHGWDLIINTHFLESNLLASLCVYGYAGPLKSMGCVCVCKRMWASLLIPCPKFGLCYGLLYPEECVFIMHSCIIGAALPTSSNGL